jgi:signal transduction histidine kinase/pSer/pThr/pTyr-binding forkhead associated (FHA) protein
VSGANLLVIQGVDQGTRFEVDQERLRIGRGAQNDVRILDTEVSRRHATLESRDDQFVLRDDNSSNGTFVNGQPIQEQVLQAGDQIQVGRTVLLFFHSAADSDVSGIADRIDLLDHDAEGGHSQIIGELGREAGDQLVKRAATAWREDEGESSPLRVLARISEEAVRASAHIDDVLKRILEQTLQAVGADRGCMLVADSRNDRIEPRVMAQRPGVNAGGRMPVSTSIVEYVIQHGQAVRTSDARHDSRFEPGHSILQAGIREAMCVPMHGRYELLGIIYVDTTTPAIPGPSEAPQPHRFNDEQLMLLLAVGRQSALAVENNRYQEALVTAERLAAVGQTIATLSHHIKNILQGVRGGSYLVDSGLQQHDVQQVRKGWGIVQRNQERIYNLVMDMLTFSKERRPELKLNQVNDVVSDVGELMQGRAAELNVQVDVTLGESIPLSMFDAEGIHRAVLNVVTNALDALESVERPDKRVQTTTRYDADEDQIVVTIADNGPGIDEDELPRLFNLFESSKGSRGTGLGLAVTQKILREHSGEISVDSRPGEGCTFRLTWPLLDEESLRADSAEHDILP